MKTFALIKAIFTDVRFDCCRNLSWKRGLSFNTAYAMKISEGGHVQSNTPVGLIHDYRLAA